MAIDTELIRTLTNLGLTEKESKVYLAVIESGTGPVSEIAQLAGINRVTAYDILEKLKRKGLVSYFTKKKVKFFSGTSPEVVIETFEQKTKKLKEVLPKLKKLGKHSRHPRITYFEGIEGIKHVYAETLKSKTEILNFSNSAEIRKKWPNYNKEYVEKRAKKKIFLRGLSPKDQAGEIVEAENEKYYREILLIDDKKFTFSNEINIYDDKVAIITFKQDLSAMVIESQEIADSQRTIFNMTWQFIKEKTEQGEAKTKMMEKISSKELKNSIKTKEDKTKIKEEKEKPDKNMSLF